MKPNVQAPVPKPEVQTGSTTLDIVVPFTNPRLTRAALSAAGRLSAGLHPFVRIVRTQVVPFPRQLDDAPVSTVLLHRQLTPLAQEFGAHLQICLTRDPREGLLQTLSKDTVVLIAARRRTFQWWPCREERMAQWLRKHGYHVVVEFEENQHA